MSNKVDLVALGEKMEQEAAIMRTQKLEDGTTLDESVQLKIAEEEQKKVAKKADINQDGMTSEEEIANYMKEHGLEQYEYVVRGANLKCSFGSHCRKLNLPKCHAVYTTKSPMVHELDCVPGPDYNISYFGVCSCPGNPNKEIVQLQAETYDEQGNKVKGAESTGNVKGIKCTPIILGTWMSTYDKTRIVDNGDKDPSDKESENPQGHPAVTTNSYLLCKFGGIIQPLSSGQEIVEQEAAIENK